MKQSSLLWLSTVWVMALVSVGQTVRAQSVAIDVPRVSHGMSELFARKVSVDLTNVSLREAIDVVARRAKVEVQYRLKDVAGSMPVTLHAKDISLDDAFRVLFRGTTLQAQALLGNHLAIVATDGVDGVSLADGTITGHVIDAKTNTPLAGVNVTLDNASRGVQTDAQGTFRFVHVSTGHHQVSARLIGRSRQARSIEVNDGGTVSVEFALEPAAMSLDQVVVTGTVVQTELRAVPNAITVITAKEIEQRGITHIDQLFRGDVPGLFAYNTSSLGMLDEVTMYSRGTTALDASSAGVSGLTRNTNPIKTYVDGIEMADPQYLSQIDPRSIERIEILAGPQASTIYGSNAINGVMQIFTKRGSSTVPQVTLNLLSGWVQNNFSSALTPQHDYSGQITGIEGKFSYDAGGGWNYLGPWTPTRQTTRTNVFGGTHTEWPTSRGALTADVTLRRSITQNYQSAGSSGDQGVQAYRASGWYQVGYRIGAGQRDNLSAQTLGLTVTYAPTTWWSHQFGIGQDEEDTKLSGTTKTYGFGPSDSLLFLSQMTTGRQSMRYTTTLQVPMTTLAHAVFTVGADEWEELLSSLSLSVPVLTGTLSSNSYTVTRQPSHNTGAFFQGQIGLLDRLFLTYGVRAEWNPNYGADAVPNYAPRYGVAYTTDIGAVTMKLRASYGRSTRPPTVSQKLSAPQTTNFVIAAYGPYNSLLANPNLGPEDQQGGEGGLELYLGSRGSLVVTRYNQTVNGLITPILGADSIRSLQPNPLFSGRPCSFWSATAPQVCSSLDTAGYAYALLSQNMNVANIRNQGWELQSNVNTGPLSFRGTYSWVRSQSLGVTQAYAAAFASQLAFSPQYRRGATLKYVPTHTWAAGVTYTRQNLVVAVNLTGAGVQSTNGGDNFYNTYFSSDVRLQQNRLNVGNVPFFTVMPGYTQAALTTSYRLFSQTEGILQIDNLTNSYVNNYNSTYATMGRQTKFGFRIRL